MRITPLNILFQVLLACPNYLGLFWFYEALMLLGIFMRIMLAAYGSAHQRPLSCKGCI